MSTRRRLLVVAVSLLVPILLPATGSRGAESSRPNVLLITADDMNYDTPGFAGNPLPGLTPNLDRLASQGIYFKHAHVTCAVCQPSRSVLMTGRYPHRNGADGFKPINRDVPTLTESTRAAGYLNAIFAKTTHLAPPEKFCWDLVVPAKDLGEGRDPALYYRHASEFFARAKAEGKPFFLMANAQDPHRPFSGSEQERKFLAGGAAAEEEPAPARPRQRRLAATTFPSPSRTFSPDEVPVPAFLPDLPGVRKELAQYYASVRRCDQTVGEVLRALDEAGLADNTLVLFLSDNGISEPFAKSNCYLTSTRTPWLVRWPGRIAPKQTDDAHFISGIDLLPTVLDALRLSTPDGTDGKSFLPLCTGNTPPAADDSRDRVVTTYNETVARKPFPMRCIQTARYGYIYNGWSDGKTQYRSEPMGGLAFAAVKQAATTNPTIAARIDLLVYRTPEELYDLTTDPACLHNLAADPAHRASLADLRASLQRWMVDRQDPLLDSYRTYLSAHP